MTLKVTMWYRAGDDPFICEVHGGATLDCLGMIEQDATDNPAETFARGDGVYTFDATWFPGQYGDFGRCEFAPCYELSVVDYKPLETEEPAANWWFVSRA